LVEFEIMNKDELKQYRERIGLTQGELSKALGVANNTVSRWELGQRSIPEFLPLALETIERRLSTVGSDSVSTVGSIDDKSTVGSLSTVGSSELNKTQSAPVASASGRWAELKAVRKAIRKKKPKQETLTAEDFAPSKSSDNEFSHSVSKIVSGESFAGSPGGEYVLTTKDAGELLNLSPRSVRENAEKGLLPGKQGKQNHWFFRRSDIDGFILRRG
jgi:DNA-binding XRE family transcriptional regulator